MAARGLAGRLILLLSASAICLVVLPAAPALAGQAASGELLFYPCTSCHPVADGAARSGRKLPNDFKGHGVVLDVHDALGKGAAACLVCHDESARNPGKLKLIDGSLIDIKGDVSSVCYRCHSAKYNEWKAGTHGRHQPKCSASGCHDPHSPGWIYAPALLPFVGAGFQFQVLPERAVFQPLAAPPSDPPVEIPVWFVALAAFAMVMAGSMIGKLILGRSKR